MPAEHGSDIPTIYMLDENPSTKVHPEPQTGGMNRLRRASRVIEAKQPPKPQKISQLAARIKKKKALGNAAVALSVIFIVLAAWVDFLVRVVVKPNTDTSDERQQVVTNPGCHNAVYDSMTLSVTNSSPMADLCDRDFLRYIAFLYWIVTVVAGIGTEIMVGTYVIASLSPETGEQLWMYAQFLFSLCAIVSFQSAASHSVFCLPFLVAGLWKFGFPETVGFMSIFLQSPKKMSWEGMCNLFNAVGTLCHHSSAALLICLMLTGLQPVTRPIIACVTPLILQHVFVLTKYINQTVYVLIELLLDVYFQWEILSNLEYMVGPTGIPQSYSNPYADYDPMVIRCAVGMMFAHECYLLGALWGLIHGMFQETEQGSGAALGALVKMNGIGSTFGGEADKEQQLMVAFANLDKDGNGLVSDSEILTALQEHGMTEAAARTLIARFDSESDGKLSFDEFSFMIQEAENIAKEFAELDHDGSGTMTVEECRKALGTTMSPEAVEHLFQHVDVGGDGTISFAEYCDMIQMVEKLDDGEVQEWKKAF